jgi:hypothetical protein
LPVTRTSNVFVAFAIGWLGWTAQSLAVTLPVTENFDSNTANWKDVASLDLTHVGSGGVGASGYVTTNLAFTNAPTGSSVLFRGHDIFNSSSDAFVGNWLTAGIQQLSAYVRHNAPQPVDYFARVAPPANFPGVIFSAPIPVQPNTWTRLDFQVSPSSPLTTVEGPPSGYNATLSNLGNVQIAALVPEPLVADPTTYTFDLDAVSIAVPEPGCALIVVVAVGIGLIVRAPRRARMYEASCNGTQLS